MIGERTVIPNWVLWCFFFFQYRNWCVCVFDFKTKFTVQCLTWPLDWTGSVKQMYEFVQASLTSYLQTVCLAIGMRTCPDDIRAVAGLCGGDVRCALLTLQFLALSRGSRTQKPQAFVQKSAKQTPCSEGRTQHGTASTKQCILADSDSDEDFVSLKPLRKKARRIVDEDDSSSVQPTTSAALKVGAASDDGGKTVDVTVDADRLPPVHLHLYQSLLGVSCDLQDILINCIKVRQKKWMVSGHR